MPGGGFWKGVFEGGRELGSGFYDGVKTMGETSRWAKGYVKANEGRLSRMASLEKKLGENATAEEAAKIAKFRGKAQAEINQVKQAMGGNAFTRTYAPNGGTKKAFANAIASGEGKDMAKAMGMYMGQGGIGGTVAKTATALVGAGTGLRIITGRGGMITNNEGEFDIAGIPFV